MYLSLLTIYRNRPNHLQTLLRWWGGLRPANGETASTQLTDTELMVIEVNENPTPGLAEWVDQKHARYMHLACGGPLHKTRGLNLGLQLSQGQFVAPLDVDLQPWRQTLGDHLTLARSSPHLLVTGYRLMLPVETAVPEMLSELIEQAAIAPEDQPTALRKHLLQGEKFGVMPFFERQRLLDIDGWDEAFVGWGAEDQDVIERYLGDGRHLCRCPHLVYLHWHHPVDEQWQSAAIVEANRQHYYTKRTSP